MSPDRDLRDYIESIATPISADEAITRTGSTAPSRRALSLRVAAGVAALLLVTVGVAQLLRGGSDVVTDVSPSTTQPAPDESTGPASTVQGLGEQDGQVPASVVDGDTDATVPQTTIPEDTTTTAVMGLDLDDLTGRTPPAALCDSVTNCAEAIAEELRGLIENPDWFGGAIDALERVALTDDGALTVDFNEAIFVNNASTSFGSAALLADFSRIAFSAVPVTQVELTVLGDCQAFWGFLQRDCEVLDRGAWEAGIPDPQTYVGLEYQGTGAPFEPLGLVLRNSGPLAPDPDADRRWLLVDDGLRLMVWTVRQIEEVDGVPTQRVLDVADLGRGSQPVWGSFGGCTLEGDPVDGAVVSFGAPVIGEDGLLTGEIVEPFPVRMDPLTGAIAVMPGVNLECPGRPG